MNGNSNSIVPIGFGATYLNSNIQTYADLIFYCKSMLGWPINNIELTDAQWAMAADDGIATFTQWGGGRHEEYLVACSDLYQPGCGIKLDKLLRVACNSQYCYQTCVVDTVTSTSVTYEDCGTYSAYLSVTPFTYPTPYNLVDPNSVPFSGLSGQFLMLNFDPKNPWNMECVCDANCVTIEPKNSQYYQLSSNACLSGIVFNFITDSSISSLASSISSQITHYPLSAVPLTGLGNTLTAIPIDYYDIACFYPQNFNVGPPVSACVNIGGGRGYIYPNCDPSKIFACSACSAQFGISPDWIHSLSGTTLSGQDGTFYDLTSRDISPATHLKLYNIPSCTLDGSIPLDSNNCIIGSFTVCNTALNTGGPMYMEKAQFFIDYKPPGEVLYDQRCNWKNNGFTMSYYNGAYQNCVRTTPNKISVDVKFSKQSITTNIGTVSTYLSSNIDPATNRTRKVIDVFSVDAGSQAGYGGYGGDLLFNFDYALLASTFGYDLQGTRQAVSRNGYDLLTYHMAKGFVEMSRDMLRYVSHQFDPKTQFLKVTPEPSWSVMGNGNSCKSCGDRNFGLQCYIVGLYVEPTIEQCVSEYFVREWTIARAMFILGQIRGMYGNTTLFSGVTLDGLQLQQYAKERMTELMTDLRGHTFESPPMFFIG